MRILVILLFLFSWSKTIAQEKKFINIKKVDVTERFKEKESEYYKLKGNIQLEHDGMILFCDSAYLFDRDNRFEAFGTVNLQKGDSVRLSSDSLFYNGNTQEALAKGNVLLKNGSISLYSTSLYYDMQKDLSYYTNHGIIYNREDTLSSLTAHYYMNQNRVNFQHQVNVRNKDYHVDSENMSYHTQSLELFFHDKTVLKSDSLDLHFNEGYYNQELEIAHCKGEVLAIKSPHSLQADSLYLDKTSNILEAYNNIIIVDSLQNLEITGNKALINQTDFTGEITGKPIAKQIQDKDTFFLKAITLFSFKENDFWNLHAYNDVKFYKNGIQGIANTLKYHQKDGIIELIQEPILWSEESQISADSVRISLSDNEIDSLFLDQNVFIIQEVDTVNLYFSQIKGRTLRGKFNETALESIHIIGNAESKYYVLNKMNVVEGLNFIQCSAINMTMSNGKIERVDFLQQPNGEYIPIQDLRSKDKFLKKFKWIPKLRPQKTDFIQ